MKKAGIYERYIKRPMDIILSLIAIVGLAPVLLLVAVLVRKKLGKPVIFTQERPGLHEKIFKLYKFRTMTDERDEKRNFLLNDVRLIPFVLDDWRIIFQTIFTVLKLEGIRAEWKATMGEFMGLQATIIGK